MLRKKNAFRGEDENTWTSIIAERPSVHPFHRSLAMRIRSSFSLSSSPFPLFFFPSFDENFRQARNQEHGAAPLAVLRDG